MVDIFTLAEMELTREKKNKRDKMYATLLIRRIYTIMTYLANENRKKKN